MPSNDAVKKEILKNYEVSLIDPPSPEEIDAANAEIFGKPPSQEELGSVGPIDRTQMLAAMQAEDEAAKPSFAKEYGKQLAGATYGAVEALSPVNIPKGIEILGRAVVTERGSPLERLSKASQKSVIPGQEEIGAGIRALVPDEGEEGLPFKERYKREMQAQEQLLPEVIAPEGRLMGNLGVAIAGITQGVRAALQARRAKALGGIPDESLPKGDVVPEEILPKAKPDDLASRVMKDSQIDEAIKASDDFDNVTAETVLKADETPKPTIADKTMAGARREVAPDATPEDVAYFRKHQDRIRSGPSLDENAPNPMSNEVLKDLEQFENYIQNKEAQAAEIIGKSNFSMTTKELAKIFKKQASKLSSSGARFTKSNQAAIKELNTYVDQILADGENVVLGPKQIRQLMQGLWKDNKASFVAGREPTVTENAVSQVTAVMNQVLKKGVGKEYAQHMKNYAPEVAALKKIYKEWRVDQAGIPQMNGWFKNRFMYHLQEAEFGNRPLSDPMLRAISVMGDRLGKNYATMVKDQLVFGRLFPEEAKGLQGGTASAVWTRAAKRAEQKGAGVVGWAREFARAGAEKIAEVPLKQTEKAGLAGKVGAKGKFGQNFGDLAKMDISLDELNKFSGTNYTEEQFTVLKRMAELAERNADAVRKAKALNKPASEIREMQSFYNNAIEKMWSEATGGQSGGLAELEIGNLYKAKMTKNLAERMMSGGGVGAQAKKITINPETWKTATGSTLTQKQLDILKKMHDLYTDETIKIQNIRDEFRLGNVSMEDYQKAEKFYRTTLEKKLSGMWGKERSEVGLPYYDALSKYRRDLEKFEVMFKSKGEK